MAGAGFQVHTGSIRQAADGFARSGDRVSAAKGTLESTALPEGAFGAHGPGPKLAGAVSDAVATRIATVSARLDRLRALSEKLNVAADEYDRGELEQQQAIEQTARGDEESAK